jgi:hypothetical protein
LKGENFVGDLLIDKLSYESCGSDDGRLITRKPSANLETKQRLKINRTLLFRL